MSELLVLAKSPGRSDWAEEAESREPTGCVMSRLSASGPRRASLWRRLRPRENAATLLRGARAATLALALAALATLAVGLPAAAQADVLVNNIGQADGSVGTLSSFDHAQAFTTGSNTGGYSLTSVEIEFAAITVVSHLDVSIWSESGGRPNSSVHDFSTTTLPISVVDSVHEFSTSGTGISLAASTTYFVVIDVDAFAVSGSIRNTMSDSEDSDGAAGWTIADSSLFRDADSTLTSAWSSFAESKKIRINGTAAGGATNSPPTVANTILNQTATVGTALNYAFPADTFNDADSDTLTYTATQSDNSALPPWLSFTAATRTFSGTPLTADVGTVSVKVTASDGTASVSDTFDIVVSAAANTAPVFATDTTSRSFTETVGDAAVTDQGEVGAVVTATDADGDSLIYTLEGTDAAKFYIVADTGQIRTDFNQKYDRETQASYSVTVKADDSNGGSDTIAVTINVDNAEEKPVAPAIPTVTATSGSTTSLDVSWMAPANTGRPAITGYKVEYRAGVSGNWLTHAHTGTGTTATIANLTAATSYQVQVLAVNSDGDGLPPPTPPRRWRTPS